MADLRTDYKDDLLDTSVNTQRKYNVVNNDDGTVSFEDATVYAQNGDTFGASEVNQIHAAVNLVSESLTVDTTNLSDDFTLNGLLQMLAEIYFGSTKKLLENGVAVSGVWSTAFVDKTNTHSVTLVDDALACKGLSSGMPNFMMFTEPINTRGYSTLHIEANGTNPSDEDNRIGIATSNAINNYTSLTNYKVPTATYSELVFDVSGYDEVYLYNLTVSTRTNSFKNIWLE